jgi:hypothetical protein
MVIIQAYLMGVRYRVISNDAVRNTPNQRMLSVELTRGPCVQTVPFTMARTGTGRWVVNQFDLERVGPPTRSCNAGSPPARSPSN